MNATDRTPQGEVERALDREIGLLMSAVDLVASGGATATTVAGLGLAEAAMAVVGPRALEAGVIIEMLWGPDERACDVRVRQGSAD